MERLGDTYECVWKVHTHHWHRDTQMMKSRTTTAKDKMAGRRGLLVGAVQSSSNTYTYVWCPHAG